MKIYVNQNDKQTGPYSQDEVRDLIYRGDVQRSALALREGAADWMPLATLLEPHLAASTTSAPPPITVSMDRLRDPTERTALSWCFIASIPVWLLLTVWTVASFGMLLPIISLVILVVMVGELWFA